ncbi:hypothetical protein [Lysinibacter cavernae]|uniref:Uncharacterized protein n=1 Tax=Lysinibacter cavernae TaxID=1640652 RepID=A0A7X5R1J0_9MICO|nr:hypothetical protein [Lysinibacter cavernae]NIH53660.1 hypothetical protein [Lysinibacter cavernae]
MNRYSSDLALGDTPTEFTIRLTVESGAASFEVYGVAGGYPFTNAGQPDQAFSGTLDRTFLVDASRESRFDVTVRSETPGAQLSCELTQGGVVISRVTGTDVLNCEEHDEGQPLGRSAGREGE